MTISTLEKAIQESNVWLAELLTKLKWRNTEHAFLALRAVLHAIRDRLPSAEVTNLGTQLPTFIRGVYYEGWKSGRIPQKDPKGDMFLAQIAREFHPRMKVADKSIARAVLSVLAKHVSNGEIQHVKKFVAKDVRVLWPIRPSIPLRRVS